MNRHPVLHESEIYRLPRPPMPTMGLGAFVFCPATLLQGLTLSQWAAQQAIYRLAFEQAQIENTPTILERDLLAVWN